nr:sulfite exporter TauE/SafE family protein [Rhodocytophaga rosea]
MENNIETIKVNDTADEKPAKSFEFTRLKWWAVVPVAVLVGLVIYALIAPAHLGMVVREAPSLFSALLTEKVLFFMLVGFIAQIIDGALGMAYGVSSTTFLLGMGVPPAFASSSVHVAEVFTSGVSGLSHLKFGNVNKKLFQSLVLPGVFGVITGAYVLTTLDEKLIKPFVAAYLMVMGIVIIRKAFKKVKEEVKEPKKVALLAVFGGFMDAVGGGGWGLS